MSLLYATALLSAGLVFARLLYIGSRLPRTPWWAKEGLMTFLIVVFVGAIAMGVGFLLESLLTWEEQVVGLEAGVAVAAMLVVAGAAWKLLGRVVPPASGDNVVAIPQADDSPDHGGTSTPSDLPTKAPRKAA